MAGTVKMTIYMTPEDYLTDSWILQRVAGVEVRAPAPLGCTILWLKEGSEIDIHAAELTAWVTLGPDPNGWGSLLHIAHESYRR